MKSGLRVVSVREFIREHTSAASLDQMHLLHSTPSSNIFDILNSGKLLAAPCKVFKQNLCYLFVGRPAFKWNSETEAKSWQLPFVIVLRASAVPPVKGIYPFDTGAFQNGRMPDYLTMFGLDAFSLGTDVGLIPSLIARFFSDNQRYALGRGLPTEEIVRTHTLGPRHAQIQALAELYSDRSNTKIDDRAKTIELQIDRDIGISSENVLGIILPQQYADEDGVKVALKELGCRVETYPEFPISIQNYFGIIYDLVGKITRSKKRR